MDILVCSAAHRGPARLVRIVAAVAILPQAALSSYMDAKSLTSATRLYEHAGMHPTMRIATFARELRSGVDLGVRELSQPEA